MIEDETVELLEPTEVIEDTPDAVEDLVERLDPDQSAGLLKKIQIARDELLPLSTRRKVCMDAFTRQPFGKEDSGSKFQAADVFDQVESTFPALIGQVLATDHQIRAKGPDDLVAKALIVRCREIIEANNSFLLYSNAIKDGLLSITGVVKLWWSRSYRQISEEHRGLTIEKIQGLEQMKVAGTIQGLVVFEEPPSVAEVPSADPAVPATVVIGPSTYSAKVTMMELTESKPVIVSVPPEQILVEKGKADTNDRRGIGHQTVITWGELLAMNERLSTPDKPFFYNLKQAFEAAGTDEATHLKEERRGREQVHFDAQREDRSDFNLTGNDLHRPVTFTEWSDNIIADGKLAPYLVWFANDVEIGNKPNEEGVVPFCAWSPFLLPHAVHGLGAAEQHVHNQDTRTVLGRALVNYVARVVDEETYILNESTDIIGLRRRVPGQLVYAQPGKDFERPAQATPLDAKLYQAIDFIKGQVHDTGPANRWTQGRDVDPRNTTATGQQIMAAASSTKINMVALVFTKCFQVDLYNKLIRLLQTNTEPFTVYVEGQRVDLDAEKIKGDYTVYSTIGKEFDIDQQRVQRASMILEVLIKLREINPMMVGPDKLFNAAKNFLIANGEQTVTDYLNTPEEMMKMEQVLMAQKQQAMLGAAPPPGAAPPAQPPGSGPGGGPSGAAPDRSLDVEGPEQQMGGL